MLRMRRKEREEKTVRIHSMIRVKSDHDPNTFDFMGSISNSYQSTNNENVLKSCKWIEIQLFVPKKLTETTVYASYT